MDLRGPTAEQIQGWLDKVEADINVLQRSIEPLLVEQSRLQERRVLLKELLASFEDRPANGDMPLRPSLHETVRERVHRQAVEIFREAGKALHINELCDEFVKRGYDIPGAGKPANITVHLADWDDIRSPQRGTYGLVEHVGNLAQHQKRPVSRRTKGRRR